MRNKKNAIESMDESLELFNSLIIFNSFLETQSQQKQAVTMQKLVKDLAFLN